jgi:hypothetical protein
MNTNDLIYTELYPKIHLYTGLLPDVSKLYEIMKKSETDANGKYYLKKWDDWAHFGTYSQSKNINEEKALGVEYNQRYDDEKYLSDRVIEAYGKAIDHYIDINNIDLPEGAALASSSFSKYKDNVKSMSNNLAMQYHTDFIESEKDMPGKKFFITCTTYINDDYDGGSVEFYIDGDVVSYKPKAGEILVFPSRKPYYHGVTNITNGQKYFIRNFIMTTFAGTEEWLKNQQERGAFRWNEIEKARCDYENPRNMLYVENGKVVLYEDVVNS